MYRGKRLSWSHGRQLDSIGDITYKYNSNGVRIAKTANGVTTKFYLDGAAILAQEVGNRLMLFTRGVDGLNGFTLDGAEYFYKKNIQGDIIAIMESTGVEIVRYVYDAWGNHKTYVLANGEYKQMSEAQNSAYAEVAQLNPYRYRSYYYDVETGLYYLNSRYYDSEVGRFINADNVSEAEPDDINGLNLYAYCLDNPVMYVDTTGASWKSFWSGVGNWFKKNWKKVVIGVAVVVVGAVVTAATAGAGVGFFAAFGAALAESAVQVGISVATSVVIGGISNVISGGSFFDNVGDTIANAIMIGGIFAGGAQIIGGGFRIASNLGVQTGRKGGIAIGKSGIKILSPDKNNWTKAGGTLIKFGKAFRIDIGAKWGLHMHILSSPHIPLGSILAGFIAGIYSYIKSRTSQN